MFYCILYILSNVLIYTVYIYDGGIFRVVCFSEHSHGNQMCVCLREKGSNQGVKIQIDGSHKIPHPSSLFSVETLHGFAPLFPFVFFIFFLQCCSICWLMRGCNWTHPSWLGQVRYLSLTHPLSFSLLLTAARLDWTSEAADVKLFASRLFACYVSAPIAKPTAQKWNRWT